MSLKLAPSDYEIYIPIGEWIEGNIKEWLFEQRPLFKKISAPIDTVLNSLETLFNFIPFPIILLIFVVLAYKTNGFKFAIRDTKYDATDKKVFILGAGGVVSSIILALIDMNVSNIIVTNRTKSKAADLKNLFKNVKTVEWGDIPDFDMIINATSLGLKNEEINLDLSNTKNDKFFYDVIYNPNETNFLRNAKIAGNYTENGKKMFIYQAAEAFRIWHGIQPKITDEVRGLIKW